MFRDCEQITANCPEPSFTEWVRDSFHSNLWFLYLDAPLQASKLAIKSCLGLSCIAFAPLAAILLLLLCTWVMAPSSLISLVIFFYNWVNILQEPDVILRILGFSFLLSIMGYLWPNSLLSLPFFYNFSIPHNLKCDSLRTHSWLWNQRQRRWEDSLWSDSRTLQLGNFP